MGSAKRPESSPIDARQLTSLIGQEPQTGDVPQNALNEVGTVGLTYCLRLKPDRRRNKSTYPPHLERRSR